MLTQNKERAVYLSAFSYKGMLLSKRMVKRNWDSIMNNSKILKTKHKVRCISQTYKVNSASARLDLKLYLELP